MELGETDFGEILRSHTSAENPGLDLATIRYYWREMLGCVASVHEYNIVHSDLKLANFLLVNSRIKLIDFDIAGAIQDDTINMHRENLVGTPNYMAPEALLDSNITTHIDMPKNESTKLVKLGKLSDIWSLACILYFMVYGTQPFGHIPGVVGKVMAITNPHHVIFYPNTQSYQCREVPESCIKTLKACLTWDHTLRPTAQTLLSRSNRFLYPDEIEEGKVGMTLESLTVLVRDTVKYCRDLELAPETM